MSLNWWCQVPEEFADKRYDFRTEVYFVGKLFEQIIPEHQINHFKYTSALRKMCERDPNSRSQSFSAVQQMISSDQFFEIEFSPTEEEVYRRFSDALRSQVTKIDYKTKYTNDLVRLVTQLNDVYRKVMLEERIPDAVVVTRCFLDGIYYYRKEGMPVWVLREFLQLLQGATDEKKRIILANLHTKLDALPRYSNDDDSSDDDVDIPF